MNQVTPKTARQIQNFRDTEVNAAVVFDAIRKNARHPKNGEYLARIVCRDAMLPKQETERVFRLMEETGLAKFTIGKLSRVMDSRLVSPDIKLAAALPAGPSAPVSRGGRADRTSASALSQAAWEAGPTLRITSTLDFPLKGHGHQAHLVLPKDVIPAELGALGKMLVAMAKRVA